MSLSQGWASSTGTTIIVLRINIVVFLKLALVAALALCVIGYMPRKRFNRSIRGISALSEQENQDTGKRFGAALQDAKAKEKAWVENIGGNEDLSEK
ncbi:hypothetical protein ElyMa_004973200 [Elysia marginata]|uniref:Uncharacterized protein n=1 Tax=Elysia marginata TaxID=1093978 RepID=A0AAV4J2X3_9GAST|nr:hypothetical protein ElyMa_004973200 [Elysia marginata]